MLSPGLSVAYAALGFLAADSGGMYLPPSETGGSEYQFNPASTELRQTVKRAEPKPSDVLDARALAEDLVFLRRALRKLYIGYPELLQLPDFDIEAMFDEQIARLRSGPPQVTFGDSALTLYRTLKSHINDSHFYMWGGGDPRAAFTEYQDVYLAPELMQKPVEELIPLLKQLPAAPASPASRS